MTTTDVEPKQLSPAEYAAKWKEFWALLYQLASEPD